MGDTPQQVASVERTGVNIRYAPYVEGRHSIFLADAYKYIVDLDNNPPTTPEIDDKVNNAFIGVGYMLSSYPALCDMFGKHMAGLDICAVWEHYFKDIQKQSAMPDFAEADSAVKLDTKIAADTKYEVEAREINAVSSSTYLMGKAQTEKVFLFGLSRFRADLQFDMLDSKAYEEYYNTQTMMIKQYAIILRLYFKTKGIMDEFYLDKQYDEITWNLQTRNHFSSFLNAMSEVKGSEVWKTTYRGRSQLSKNLLIVSEAMKGAAIGFFFGGWYGAGVGAQIGTNLGTAQILREEGKWYWWAPWVFGPEFTWWLALL